MMGAAQLSRGQDDREALAEEVELLRATASVLRARIAELELLADTDSLTPLPNRRAFVRELTRTIQNKVRHDEGAALLYVDLNGLKQINDTHGHSAGDAVILHVARELRTRTRVTDTVARIGGDEFAIILNRIDGDMAKIKAEALMADLGTTSVDLGAVTLPIGIRCGVTMIEAEDEVSSVLARADAAMYAARAGSKPRW